MQVALNPGAAIAPLSQPSTQESQATSRVLPGVDTVVRFFEKKDFAGAEARGISPFALMSLNYIANSTKLPPKDKHTLIRLVAMVDEFAGGNAKLMKQVMNVAGMMEMGAKQSSAPMTLREAIREYLEHRAALHPDESVSISVETEINAASVEATGAPVTQD